MGAIIYTFVRAKLLRGVHSRIRASGSDHTGAEKFRGLDSNTAEPAGGSHDQHPFAWLNIRAVAQLCECERGVPCHHRGSHEIKTIGDKLRPLRRESHILGIATPPVHAK